VKFEEKSPPRKKLRHPNTRLLLAKRQLQTTMSFLSFLPPIENGNPGNPGKMNGWKPEVITCLKRKNI